MNHIKLSIVLCLWVVLLLFLGCGKVGKNKASETEITTMRKDAESEWASMFEMVCEENGCYIDDTSSLDTLSAEYELKELEGFFEAKKMGELNDLDIIGIKEVEDQFPIGIIRSNSYSIYKVKEGGFFFVFWGIWKNKTGDVEEAMPVVSFTAYIQSKKDPSSFNDLIPGISTAKDVEEIDPYFDLNRKLNIGAFSYSLINEDNLLEIEYTWNADIQTYDDFYVKCISIVSRKRAPTYYRFVEDQDLQWVYDHMQ